MLLQGREGGVDEEIQDRPSRILPGFHLASMDFGEFEETQCGSIITSQIRHIAVPGAAPGLGGLPWCVPGVNGPRHERDMKMQEF